jgi:DNA invertase Pin-like site-specific DNA recombinase
MTATFRIALYARVSTNGKLQDPEMQLRELREYATRRGWEIVAEFVDRGVSGTKEKRPQLDAMMLACQQRAVDAVMVWKLDRFARSLKHLVNALAEFDALGVAFISLRDNLDLTTPAGRLMFQIVGAMAEFERSLIVERVRAGLHNPDKPGYSSKGNRLGRPRVGVPVAKIERLKREGVNLREIARQVGVSKTTILRALAA